MRYDTVMAKLDWMTLRELSSLVAGLAEQKQKEGGKSIEVFGKLNPEGERYILGQLEICREDAETLRTLTRMLMADGR